MSASKDFLFAHQDTSGIVAGKFNIECSPDNVHRANYIAARFDTLEEAQEYVKQCEKGGRDFYSIVGQ